VSVRLSDRRLPLGVATRWLPVAVSAVGTGFIGWRFVGQWAALSQGIRELRLSWLTVAWLVYALTFYVLALRIKLILGAYGIRHSLNRFLALTLIGTFFSSVLPMSVGGDLVKAAYAAERGDRLPEAVLGVLADRGMGLLGVILLADVGLWLRPSTGTASTWLPVVSSTVSVGLILGVIGARYVHGRAQFDGLLDDSGNPLARALKRLARATITLTNHPVLLIGAFVLTLVAQALGSLTLWAEALAFGMNVSLPILLLALPVIALATIVPSLNGIGVREAALVIALQGMLPEPQAFLLALTFDALAVSGSLIGAGTYLLRQQLGIRISVEAGVAS
jgi:uncharacterized protein (TIRG00374 family)